MRYLSIIAGLLLFSLSIFGADKPIIEFPSHADKIVNGDNTQSLPVKAKVGYRFNGKNNYVEFSGNEQPEQFTFVVWCAPEKQVSRVSLICKVGWHTQLGLTTRGKPYFKTYTEDKKSLYISSKPISYNKWTMLCGVCFGSNIVLYIDGKMASFAETPKKLLQNNGKYFIGCSNSKSKSSPGFYNGLLDAARVWDRALSPEEIIEIYNKEKVKH